MSRPPTAAHQRAPGPSPHFHRPPRRAHQTQCSQLPPMYTAQSLATSATPPPSRETSHPTPSQLPSPPHASSAPAGNIRGRSRPPAPKLPVPPPTSEPSETSAEIRDSAQSPPPPASAAA